MIWQELVISAGAILLTLAVIPTISSSSKPPVITSFILSFVIYTFAFAFATLGLWFTAGANALNATAWLVVLIQTLRMEKSSSTEEKG